MTPHNFLLNLRTVNPGLARLFDGVTRLSLSGGTLLMRIDPALWPGSEITERKTELDGETESFFGRGCKTKLESAPLPAGYIPAPITATKYYNHIAFLRFGPDFCAGYFVIRKTLYSEKYLKGGLAALDPGEYLLQNPVECPPGRGPDDLLRSMPGICDHLCGLARTSMSYVQILTLFPGHDFADLIESRLYAIKEWGTPGTPPAVLQKYLGRIHYADRCTFPAGFDCLKI